MMTPASVLENDTLKLLWDFDIQTDHLIPTRRPDLLKIYKKQKTRRLADFAVPTNHRVKIKENEKGDNFLDFTRKQKNIGIIVTPTVTNILGTIPKSLEKRFGKVGNRRTNSYHPNCCIIKIGRNTEKSSGDPRRLAVTQIPVKDYQLTLVRRTLKKSK